MIIFEELLLVGVVLLAALLIVQMVQKQQQERRLQDAFYRSLELDSCISLIQLATRARVEAAIAKEFLEIQAQAFSASLETDAEGETFYRFPKLRLYAGRSRDGS